LKAFRVEINGAHEDAGKLDPMDVLSDLLGEDCFEIADTRLAAIIILQRLRDAGFKVVPTEEGQQ
jgi:hypothetical protein